MKRILLLTMLGLVALRCATLAENAGGDSNLPSAGVGPFRKLTADELPSTPLVLDDQTANYHEPCALALGDGTSEVALYVAMTSSQQPIIARTRATDGRTFFGATLDVGHKPQQVLASDQPWEGNQLSHPSVLRVGSEIWLYYTANGSVGLAKGTDGFAFTKVSAPVLVGAIQSASVALLPDGTFDMMFTDGVSIFEAKSADGVAWQPNPTPVLAPSPPAQTLAPGQLAPIDTDAVRDPFIAPRMTAANRLQIRVLYTGHSTTEAGAVSAIGFAARYGEDGPLTRGDGAVYSTGKNESSPTLFEFNLGSLLYVEQNQTTYRAIGVGFAPPTNVLPPPDTTYPASP